MTERESVGQKGKAMANARIALSRKELDLLVRALDFAGKALAEHDEAHEELPMLRHIRSEAFEAQVRTVKKERGS